MPLLMSCANAIESDDFWIFQKCTTLHIYLVVIINKTHRHGTSFDFIIFADIYCCLTNRHIFRVLLFRHSFKSTFSAPLHFQIERTVLVFVALNIVWNIVKVSIKSLLGCARKGTFHALFHGLNASNLLRCYCVPNEPRFNWSNRELRPSYLLINLHGFFSLAVIPSFILQTLAKTYVCSRFEVLRPKSRSPKWGCICIQKPIFHSRRFYFLFLFWFETFTRKSMWHRETPHSCCVFMTKFWNAHSITFWEAMHNSVE